MSDFAFSLSYWAYGILPLYTEKTINLAKARLTHGARHETEPNEKYGAIWETELRDRFM
jgi:hypothetical protein